MRPHFHRATVASLGYKKWKPEKKIQMFFISKLWPEVNELVVFSHDEFRFIHYTTKKLRTPTKISKSATDS